MRLRNKPIRIKGPEDKITIQRSAEGVPHIIAKNQSDLFFAQGWVHANDRLLQMLLSRLVGQGRLAEFLGNREFLIQVDMYLRRVNLRDDALIESEKLDEKSRKLTQAYCDGVNSFLAQNGLSWELKLLKIAPEKWEISDVILMLKIMGYIGLTQSQGKIEKWLAELLKYGFPLEKIQELFPLIRDHIDYKHYRQLHLEDPVLPETEEFLGKLFSFKSSNNWSISPRLSESNAAIMCNDPHLEVNRIPAIWSEIILEYPDNYIIGASVPGTPAAAIGRNRYTAWGTTYSYMDSVDYFLEHCKAGKYKEGKLWHHFTVREEKIKIKNNPDRMIRIYENPRGFLEGNPEDEGYYLNFAWTGRNNTGAEELKNFIAVMESRSVKDSMQYFRQMGFAGFSWNLADQEGNIGMQMSGRIPRRHTSLSGLLPVPGWDRKYHWKGVEPSKKNPAIYNPKEGYVITANNDLNQFGKSRAISNHMGNYRSQRIEDLIKKKKRLNRQDMVDIQYDLYSLQAEKFMKIIRPLLPENEKGRLLKDWDLCYTAASKGATLFEAIYKELYLSVFGHKKNLGNKAVQYLWDNTGLVNALFYHFDLVLLKKKSRWFVGRSQKNIYMEAIEKGLQVEARPYGEVQTFIFKHLIFGEAPSVINRRFNRGPYPMEGSRGTVKQGQLFGIDGNRSSFAPSYRIIVDFAQKGVYSNLPGGPSDRVFSRWYSRDIDNWLNAKYKYSEPTLQSQMETENDHT